MTTAILALVGVVVGAIVTGTVTAVVDLVSEHRRTERAAFLAKRLVGEELQTVWMHLDGLLARGVTPKTESAERRAQFMPTAAWEEHKETLAVKGALTDDEWTYVSSLLHAVDSLRLMILEEPLASPLSADLRSKVNDQRALVADVYQSLTGSDLGMAPSS